MATPITAIPFVAKTAEDKAVQLGGQLLQAAQTPLYKREKITTRENEYGEPVAIKTEVAVPAWLVAFAALLGVGAAQRGLRTGTVGLEQQTQWEITAPLPEDTFEGGVPHGKTRKVWIPATDVIPNLLVGERGVRTGKTRGRPRLRTRDSIADYQPFARL